MDLWGSRFQPPGPTLVRILIGMAKAGATVARFLLALSEAILKCWIALAIAFIPLYILIVAGQGREAMMALFNGSPMTSGILASTQVVSQFATYAALICTSLIAFFFLHFLLGKWNYRARDGGRAFIRIWLPAVLALSVGLMYPVAVALSPQPTRIWEAMTGLASVAAALGAMGAAWWWTTPSIPAALVAFIAVAVMSLLGAFVFGQVLLFYGLSLVLLTVFCIWVRRDFRDGNPNLRPRTTSLPFGLGVALLLGIVAIVFSNTGVGWRMFLGAPSLLLFGFSFLLALAYVLAAAASAVSPILVRLVWVGLAALVLVSPIEREEMRYLRDQPLRTDRPSPSAHFLAWLAARTGGAAAGVPYPVFLVAAQGGGIRAAYWTSTMLAALEERYPGFTDHVYAISSVSGGSVGSVVYGAMYHEWPARRDRGCAPLVQGGIHGLRACTAYVFAWDLLGPTLGALLFNDIPFGWHGRRRAGDLEQSLENAWFLSLESRALEQPLQSLWGDDVFRVPSLILNTTSVRNGHRIVVSNLKAEGELTAEPDVESTIGHPLRLSTAAFLSARFPLISPEATFSPENAAGTGSESRTLRLVDGGYFNNSGTASISRLLQVIAAAQQDHPDAARVRPMVLVLASDVEPAASRPGRFAGSLAAAVGEPVSVLAHSSDAHELSYLAEIEALTRPARAIYKLRPPQGSQEVALGWLLSDETRCKMDRMVNDVVNHSEASTAIAAALPAVPDGLARGPASWTSCPVDKAVTLGRN